MCVLIRLHLQMCASRVSKSLSAGAREQFCAQVEVAYRAAETAMALGTADPVALDTALGGLKPAIHVLSTSQSGKDLQVMEACTPPQFTRSLLDITDIGKDLLPQNYHSEAASSMYAGMSSRHCVPNPPTKEWPISKRQHDGRQPLIINAGEGTTGSTYVDCIFEQLGLPEQDQRKKDALLPANDYRGCEPTCTEGWDHFDYVSNTPVPYEIWALLKTHPEALVLLPVRDSQVWQKERLASHPEAGTWRQAAPCGATEHTLDHGDAPTAFIVYNAWVKCVTNPSKLFEFNLFEDDTSAIISRLLRFLDRHHMKFPNQKQFQPEDLDLTCRGVVNGGHNGKPHLTSSHPIDQGDLKKSFWHTEKQHQYDQPNPEVADPLVR
jgi:hypothetical protein